MGILSRARPIDSENETQRVFFSGEQRVVTMTFASRKIFVHIIVKKREAMYDDDYITGF